MKVKSSIQDTYKMKMSRNFFINLPKWRSGNHANVRVQEYKGLFSKIEEQMQFILQIVRKHQNLFPVSAAEARVGLT